jgi:hypothetical protein
MSTKPHVIQAFKNAGIDHTQGTPYNTCAILFGDRYVAYFGGHEGWQIAKGTSPKGRCVVSQDQAVAWALRGEWSDGSSCKQGYRVDENGVEKGRKVEAETPVVAAATISQPQIDRARLLLALVEKGFSKEEIQALLG